MISEEKKLYPTGLKFLFFAYICPIMRLHDDSLYVSGKLVFMCLFRIILRNQYFLQIFF